MARWIVQKSSEWTDRLFEPQCRRIFLHSIPKRLPKICRFSKKIRTFGSKLFRGTPLTNLTNRQVAGSNCSISYVFEHFMPKLPQNTFFSIININFEYLSRTGRTDLGLPGLFPIVMMHHWIKGFLFFSSRKTS